MEDRERLLSSIDKIHTTEMGEERIRRNLNLQEENVVELCKSKVMDKSCNIYRKGKNYYCELDNIRLTINAFSYTIITAHKMK